MFNKIKCTFVFSDMKNGKRWREDIIAVPNKEERYWSKKRKKWYVIRDREFTSDELILYVRLP